MITSSSIPSNRRDLPTTLARFIISSFHKKIYILSTKTTKRLDHNWKNFKSLCWLHSLVIFCLCDMKHILSSLMIFCHPVSVDISPQLPCHVTCLTATSATLYHQRILLLLSFLYRLSFSSSFLWNVQACYCHLCCHHQSHLHCLRLVSVAISFQIYTVWNSSQIYTVWKSRKSSLPSSPDGLFPLRPPPNTHLLATRRPVGTKL